MLLISIFYVSVTEDHEKLPSALSGKSSDAIVSAVDGQHLGIHMGHAGR